MTLSFYKLLKMFINCDSYKIDWLVFFIQYIVDVIKVSDIENRINGDFE